MITRGRARTLFAIAAIRFARSFYWVIPLSLLLSSHLSNGADNENVEPLFQAIAARLALMENVAEFKAQNHLPIEDLAREALVLADVKILARTHGIDADSIAQFFIAQMNSAKAIQYRRRAELLNQDLPQNSIDLQAEIRPNLDRLGSEIITLFDALLLSQDSLKEDSRVTFMFMMQHRLLTDIEKNALFDAMLQVRRSEL
jgi:chorismate mutase